MCACACVSVYVGDRGRGVDKEGKQRNSKVRVHIAHELYLWEDGFSSISISVKWEWCHFFQYVAQKLKE